MQWSTIFHSLHPIMSPESAENATEQAGINGTARWMDAVKKANVSLAKARENRTLKELHRINITI